MANGDGKEGSVIATLLINDPILSAEAQAEEHEPRDLTLANGERQSTIQLREGQTFRLGRAKTNDYAINNRNVSRFHAVFSASPSGIVLSDLSSLNGTMVNGDRISTPVDISSGDVITIGETTITVKLSLGEETSSDSFHGRTQTAQLASVVVTVLVVDVCGYTKLSESLPPKDVAEMMQLWFQRVSSLVEKHGGMVDKYIGDCVMALWRGKHSNAAALALHAVEAGKEILAETGRMSEREWRHHQDTPWTCRVALNTGEALMGTVGGGGKRDFTVLGDTVNVAFRLEGVAGDLDTEFILSGATAEMVQEKFPVRSLGQVNVAGRTGEVKIFTLA